MKNFDRDKEYIFQDKTQEERLRIAVEAAEAASRTKSEFINRMSHDIRTPLNAIIGMTDLAAANIDNKRRVQDCLKKISLSGNHLLKLINEILDMNKIENGAPKIRESEANLGDIIDDMLAMINPQIYEKNHTLEIKVHNLIHEDILGDSLRIKEVFVNLISNAIKYTNNGGKIVMEITEKESRVKNKALYEFVFKDNGIGMDKEFVKHIFDPFLRAENAENTPVEGTGLGMTIARSIIQMMGGDITVNSVLGEGSEFIVTMYLKYYEKSEWSYATYHKMSVLIVDNIEKDSLKLLENKGIHCDICRNSMEAVNMLENKKKAGGHYDVILSGDSIENSHYIETAKTLNQMIDKDSTILAVMSYDWHQQEEAEKDGIYEFITKPLFCSRVFKLLDRLSDRENVKMTAATEEAGPSQKLDFSGYRVMIVEDNDLNLEIASEIIEITGAEVETAKNGLEAVNKLEKLPKDYFDLIFMDIRMPKMDGYKATNMIRNSGMKDIPIIAMTANAFADDVAMSKAAGMNDHIVKPLKMNIIFQTMEKWLPKKVIDEYRKIVI